MLGQKKQHLSYSLGIGSNFITYPKNLLPVTPAHSPHLGIKSTTISFSYASIKYLKKTPENPILAWLALCYMV